MRVCVCSHTCVHVCVSSPRNQDLKTLWLRDPTAQRHTAISEKISEGTQNCTRKHVFCRFCILRSSMGLSGTPVFVSFCVVSREGGAQAGTRGITMFIGTLFCYLLLFLKLIKKLLSRSQT